jgi:hypothetical protein
MSNPEKEAIAKAPSGRVTRTPVGVRNVLTVKGKDPNYVYRIVNADEDRVEQYEAAGYEVCKASDVKVGDRRVNKGTPEGSIQHFSVGGGTKGVVMRIRKDWYEEDEAAKQREVNATEETMKADALKSGDYGKLEIGRKPT